MTTDVLAPCPFCGIPGELANSSSNRGQFWYAGCDNEDCPVESGTTSFKSPAEATAAWNTRAALSTAEASDVRVQAVWSALCAVRLEGGGRRLHDYIALGDDKINLANAAIAALSPVAGASDVREAGLPGDTDECSHGAWRGPVKDGDACGFACMDCGFVASAELLNDREAIEYKRSLPSDLRSIANELGTYERREDGDRIREAADEIDLLRAALAHPARTDDALERAAEVDSAVPMVPSIWPLGSGCVMTSTAIVEGKPLFLFRGVRDDLIGEPGQPSTMDVWNACEGAPTLVLAFEDGPAVERLRDNLTELLGEVRALKEPMP